MFSDAWLKAKQVVSQSNQQLQPRELSPESHPPTYSESTEPNLLQVQMAEKEKMDLPSRSVTTATNATSDDEAVPSGDPSTTTGLLQERTQAWKHMCGYLEGYITAVTKDEKTKSKEQERILKVRTPLHTPNLSPIHLRL